MKVPIAMPYLGEEEGEAVTEVLRSGWVTQGPRVAAFEQAFAEYVGAPHAAAASSGTTALHLALLAAGVGDGDEVVTVSHSYIATPNAVRYCGAVPVFVDIQPGTFNMDPALVAAAITPKTKAVMCVHQLGMPCDMAAILSVTRPLGIPVIEDAACAAGSEIQLEGEWQRVGRPHGDAACFSFHPRKVLTTGDGGMITTRHAEWDEKFRLLRQHAMSVPDTVRHGASKVTREQYPCLGFNYRLTDIQAAVGLVQLKRLPDMVARRQELAARYRELLGGIPGLALPEEPAWARSNWQSYCVRLPAGANQDEVMQALLDREVATRTGVMCTHREPAYATGGPEPCRFETLPESEAAQDRCLMLPLFHQITDEQMVWVAESLGEVLG